MSKSVEELFKGAPDGTTHWDKGISRTHGFMKLENGFWFYWPSWSTDPDWEELCDFGGVDMADMIPRPQPKPWSGPEDGLPPGEDEFFIRRHNFQMPPVSAAPDGATHWDSGIRCTPTWAMKCDGIWYWHPVYGEAIENCWSPYSNLSLDPTTFIRIEHKWNGDGLPPVNAIVHCGTHNRDVEVLTKPELISHASGEYVTAACRAIDNQELFWGGRFNPIRTLSEIAAEKRETAIREFMDVVGIDCRVTASKAVDAGFKREVV